MKFFFLSCLSILSLSVVSQAGNSFEDTAASGILRRVSGKYKAFKDISANFMLIIQQPKVHPEDDDRKYADTVKGQIYTAGDKFKVVMKGQQIFCDGKIIWTYTPADKEVQVNYFEENEDEFSPSKIFILYKQGYLYQIKETK